MSFWKSLFGRGSEPRDEAPKVLRQIEHNGFTIQATPYAEAGQFQVCGVISKQIDGAMRTHRFVRADRFGTLDEAADFAILKGRQIVDQQGERMFDER